MASAIARHGRWGFWKCFHWMCQRGAPWSHKRVHRVYKSMHPNLLRRARKRLPTRVRQPLDAPGEPGRLWSMDFMRDTLYHGIRFRTLNVFDEGVREVLAIEIDSSLTAGRVIRVLEQLKESHGLPQQIRVDNGLEFTSSKLLAWCEINRVPLHHIQPGKPTQNANIERFNRSFRHEVLNAHLFGSLGEVREGAWQWLIRHNEERPNASFGNLPPAVFRKQQTNKENQPQPPETSISEMSH